jgi:peroxiredoxin
MAQNGIAIGSPAPAFTLKDQNEKDVALDQFKGRKVVLAFHPLAWTAICTTQMQDLEANRAEFAKRGGVALGFSVDSVPCKTAWAKSIGVSETSILADFWPHGGVAKAYDLFRQHNGFSERAVVIVDAGGTVAWKKVYPIREVPDVKEILAALDAV